MVAWKLNAATFELSSWEDVSPALEPTVNLSTPDPLDDLRVIVLFLTLSGTFGGGPPL